jgi:predicted anti-sigma-YlaC factor YlaD
MQCHDVREWLRTQPDGAPSPSNALALEEHLQTCSSCRAFKARLHFVEAVTYSAAPCAVEQAGSISTDRIMQAIQQRKRVSSQLEDIHRQQQSRMVRLRPAGAACVALCCFTLSSIPLLLLALCLVQTDLTVKALYVLDNIIDIFIILAQYLQIVLTMITQNRWLLPALAFAVIVMTGMWLRLMRYPQEA